MSKVNFGTPSLFTDEGNLVLPETKAGLVATRFLNHRNEIRVDTARAYPEARLSDVLRPLVSGNHYTVYGTICCDNETPHILPSRDQRISE